MLHFHVDVAICIHQMLLGKRIYFLCLRSKGRFSDREPLLGIQTVIYSRCLQQAAKVYQRFVCNATATEIAEFLITPTPINNHLDAYLHLWK